MINNMEIKNDNYQNCILIKMSDECIKNGKYDINCMKKQLEINCFAPIKGKTCPILQNYENFIKSNNMECNGIYEKIKSCSEKQNKYRTLIKQYNEQENSDRLKISTMEAEIINLNKARKYCQDDGFSFLTKNGNRVLWGELEWVNNIISVVRTNECGKIDFLLIKQQDALEKLEDEFRSKYY